MPPGRARKLVKTRQMKPQKKDPAHKGTLGQSRGRERGQGGGNAGTEPELLCPQWLFERNKKREIF
jgi:hypothetical protein